MVCNLSRPFRHSLERPMRIELVVDPSKPLPLASRVAAPAKAAATANVHRAAAPRRKRAPRKNERPAKSAADLDAEMEDYTSANAPAAA
jgi:THO complex subunit 4